MDVSATSLMQSAQGESLMGMEAYQHNPWRARAATLSKDATRMVFLFTQDVLLSTASGKMINQNNLLFTLSHLWQAGHMLAVICKPSRQPQHNLGLVRNMAASIKDQTGVSLVVATPSSDHEDHLKHHSAFENHKAMHPNARGNNATIMLSLAALGLYCKPNALQRGLIMDPSTVLPGETKAMHTHRKAITSTQVVLVGDDPHAMAQAKAIGYQGSLVSPHANISNQQERKHPNQHLQHLLANHTRLAQQSMAWLHHSKHPTHAYQPLHGMNWLHYQYYLIHFHPHMGLQQNRKIHRRAWQHCTPKSKRSWVKNSQKGLVIIVVGGIGVACISTGFAMLGVGGMFGIAAASIGIKLMLAKAGLGFGIGSASGSMMLTLKKMLFWRKKTPKKTCPFQMAQITNHDQ